MKQSFVVSLPIAAFGFLLALVPLRLLPVCAVHAGVAPMKCHWSGMMLAGFGGTFVVFAALLFACKNAEIRKGLSLAAVALTLTAGLVPTQLIGLCASPAMPCRTGTFPAVMIALALLALAGLFNLVYLRHTGARESYRHESIDHAAHSLEQS